MDEFLSRSAQPVPPAAQDETRSLGSADATADWTETPANAGTLPRWSAPRFRTIRSHAKGGLGEVFLAEDLEFEREVALKEILQSKLDNPVARNDFSREGRITGRLEHPNIAPVYSLGQFEDGRPFYVMRFIRGASLKEAIARFHGTAPLSKSAKDTPAPEAMSTQAEQAETTSPQNRDLELRQLLGSFVQVCNAVAFAHSKGVIHRDIKPANIMLGDFGETLLVDWGLARATGDNETTTRITGENASEVDAATQQGQIKGTPAYMSPEQARGDIAQLGPATDIYSLGATLYTLLTGKVPVEGKSKDEYLTNVKAGRVTPPRLRTPQHAIAKPLDAICMKAMKLDPADRYATARLLAADIEHYLADEPVTAIADPITVRARRWLRKHPALATAATLLLLVSLAGSLGFAALERNHGIEIAKKQRESEENFQDAMAAVDKYVNTAQEADLLKEERFKPLLKELLKDANEFYQKFIKRSEGKSERMPELALALYNVGRLSSDNGDVEVAKAASRRAVETYTVLVQDNPMAAEYQNGLAMSYNNLGALQSNTSDLAGARASLDRAIEIGEKLVRENPTVAEYQSGLADNFNNLGLMQFATLDLNGARTSNERAIEIREKLVQQNPTVADYQGDLAGSYSFQGRLHYETSDLDGALSSLNRAIEIGEKLVQQNPTLTQDQRRLAFFYTHLGTLQLATSDLASAQASYERSFEIREKLVQQNPTVVEYQSDLAWSCNNLGGLQHKTSDLAGERASYERAIEIWKKLVQENPTVTEYQNGLASSYVNLGGLQKNTSDLASARASFNRAIEIGEKLVEQNPTVADYQGDLAASYDILGALQNDTSDLDGALASYERAIEILEKLVQQNLKVTEYQSDLARSYINLGRLQRDTSDIDSVWTSYTRAIEIQEKLVQKNPTVIDYQSELALSYINLGILQSDASDFHGARASFERAMEIWEKLARENPTVTYYQKGLALSYTNLGNVQGDISDLDGAVASYEQAIEIFEILVQQNPTVTEYQSKLALSYSNLAITERSAARPDKARAVLIRAEPYHRDALLASPQNGEYRQFFRNNRWNLSKVCIELQLHAEAVSAAREWAEYANDTADAVEAVAHICQCIPLAKKDEVLSDEAKKQAVQEYGDAAMEILTKMVSEGVNGERLTDPAAFSRLEFLPLTLRKDFQELLGSLGNAGQ